MATTIKLKNGSGAPAASDLVQGEPAFDLTNKRLYTENGSGTVIEIGTKPSTIDINAGTIDGAVIGGSSAAAGTFTTITGSGDLAVDTDTLFVDVSEDRVGINTTSPLSPLSVHGDGTTIRLDGTGNTTRSIFFRNTTSSNPAQIFTDGSLRLYTEDSGTDIRFHTNSNGSTNERMRINSSGNVGIGTSSPVDKLHVYSGASGGSPHSYTQLLVENSTHQAIELISPNTSEQAVWFSDPDTASVGGFSYYHPTNVLSFRTSNDWRMDLSATSAATTLNILSGSEGLIQFKNGGTVKGYINVPNTRFDIVAGTGSDIRLVPDGSGGKAVTVDTSGNLLVGGTSAAAASATTIAPDGGIKAILASGTGGEYLFGAISGVSNGHQISVDTSNNQTYKWHNGGTANMTLTSAGQLILPGVAGDTTSDAANLNIRTSDGLLRRSTSSRRYKNDITDATHGLTELLALRSVTYKGNNDGDRIFGGLIAEEVHEAGLTEFVQYDSEGNPDALAYGHMIALCVKAIQELTARVAELEGA